jgi:uncharacterized protein YndB with AHSA1/START domain
METLHFVIYIKAPVEKVWDTMFDSDTYQQWTAAFQPGSRFEGSWEQDAKIKFVDGSNSGMISRIKENSKHLRMVIEHLGVIHDGVEDTTSPEAAEWAPALETYTFGVKNEGTELKVDMEVQEEHRSMFEDMWPKALQALKKLAEQ